MENIKLSEDTSKNIIENWREEAIAKTHHSTLVQVYKELKTLKKLHEGV